MPENRGPDYPNLGSLWDAMVRGYDSLGPRTHARSGGAPDAGQAGGGLYLLNGVPHMRLANGVDVPVQLPPPTITTRSGAVVPIQLPPSNPHPQAPHPDMHHAGLVEDADTAARTFGGGVPVFGPAAKYGGAAIAATVGPRLEPWMDRDPNHDRSTDVTPGGAAALARDMDPADTWMGRFNRDVAMQNDRDAQFAAQHPVLSKAGRGAGNILGGLAESEVLAPLTAAKTVAEDLSVLWPSLRGAAVGGLKSGVDGYLRGHGGWDDPSRLRDAGQGAAQGALFGGAAPSAKRVGKWASDYLFGPRAPAGSVADDLAGAPIGAPPEGSGAAPNGPQIGKAGDLASLLSQISPDGALVLPMIQGGAHGTSPTLADALNAYFRPDLIQAAPSAAQPQDQGSR